MKKSIILLSALFLLFSCSPSEQELFDEGIKLMEAGQLDKSIGFFDRAIQKNEQFTAAYNAKGVAFFQQQAYDSAIVSFTAAIRLDSTSYKSFFNRGNAHLEKKAYKEALIDYNYANGLDLQQVDVYYNRGLALLGMEAYEDALLDFDMALQANPNQPLALFNKAKAQLGNNDPLGALETLATTVEVDSRNGAAFYLLGVTQMSALGMKEEGCANLKISLSLGYTEAKTWINDFCQE